MNVSRQHLLSRLIPVLAATLIIGVACSSAKVAGDESQPTVVLTGDPAEPCGKGMVLFKVAFSGGEMLPEVKVRAVGPKGRDELGTTDAFGQVCLSEEDIFRPGVEAILFCRSGYFCGAFVPSEEKQGFRERFIALARLEIP